MGNRESMANGNKENKQNMKSCKYCQMPYRHIRIHQRECILNPKIKGCFTCSKFHVDIINTCTEGINVEKELSKCNKWKSDGI